MADKDGVADIVKGIQADITTIVRGEIELAKAELMPQAKAAGMGAGMFGAAAYLAITASTLLFFTLAFLVAMAFGAAGMGVLPALVLGFAIVTVALLLIAGLLALVGKGKFAFKKPALTIGSAEQTVASVRSAMSSTTKEIAGRPLVERS